MNLGILRVGIWNSQKFTSPRNGKEKKVWGSEKTLGSAKACGLWQLYEGKIRNFFFRDQGTHGHAWLLDFLSDLAWPCAQPCLVACFSVWFGMAMHTAMPGCMFFCLIWHGHAHSHVSEWIFTIQNIQQAACVRTWVLKTITQVTLIKSNHHHMLTT